MSPKTKKRLLVAGGIVGGAVLVFGALVAIGGKAKAGEETRGPSAPTASDSDIDAVVQKALVVETDPATLRELARFMRVLPYGNPLRNQIGVLEARATALEERFTNVDMRGDVTATFKQMLQS